MNKLKLLFINIYVIFSTIGLLSQDAPGYNKDCNLWILSDKVSANYSSASASVWTPLQTPVNSQILDIFFIDSLTGWACHNGMGAMRTSNSGVNWETASFNDTTFTTGFNGIYFINSNTGWSVGGALQIRKTTNGGANWSRQIPPPAAGILRSVWFFDPNTGYAAGSKNFPYVPFVCKTTNGGVTWTEVPASFAGAQELNEQYWFDASTGWICGYDVLLYTTNGGTSFTNLYSNVPPSNNGHTSLLAINFVNQQTGWIGAANIERSNVYKTTNGGANWVFQNNPISQGGMNQINDISFVSADIGWAVHGTPTSGAIMYTSNGGNNWVTEEISVNWFDCLHIYQNRKAWCGSSGGKIWFTIPLDPVGISHTQEIPSVFKLGQNYPNPFNPTTHFEFLIADFGLVTLKVYDILGREAADILNKELKPGIYEIEFDGSNLPSGVYFYELTAGGFKETKKMLMIK